MLPGALAFCSLAGALCGHPVGVGSEAWREDLERDRSLRLVPPHLGRDGDLILSPAVPRMGVHLEVGEGAAGVCPSRSFCSHLGAHQFPQVEII